MPIYEYICQNCGEKYEKLVRSNAAQVKLICPSCGSSQAEKALSLFGAIGNTSSPGQALGSNGPSCGPIG